MTKNIKGRKFVATAATAALVASAIVPVASAAEFSDASKIADWAKEHVEYAKTNGLLSGNADGTFNPEGNFSRAQAAQVIVNYLGLDTKNTTAQFSDVSADEWYYGVVNAAKVAGKVDGIGEGKFNPEGNLSRQDAAKLFGSLLNLDPAKADKKVLDQFNDKASIADYADEYVAIFVAAGAINGKGEGFDPTGLITRQELAKIISLAVQADKAGKLDAYKVVEEVSDVAIKSVSAINSSKEIELTFDKNPKDLTATDFEVSSNLFVVSVVPTSGNKAKVTFSTDMTDGAEYTIGLLDAEGEVSSSTTFTYELGEVDSITLTKNVFEVGENAASFLKVYDAKGVEISTADYNVVNVESSNVNVVDASGNVVNLGTANLRFEIEYKDGSKTKSGFIRIDVDQATTGNVAGFELASAASFENTVEYKNGSRIKTDLYLGADVAGLNLFVYADDSKTNPEIAPLDLSTSGDYTVTSKSPAIVSVTQDASGVLVQPIAKGKATIEISGPNKYKKTITIEVKEDPTYKDLLVGATTVKLSDEAVTAGTLGVDNDKIALQYVDQYGNKRNIDATNAVVNSANEIVITDAIETGDKLVISTASTVNAFDLVGVATIGTGSVAYLELQANAGKTIKNATVRVSYYKTAAATKATTQKTISTTVVDVNAALPAYDYVTSVDNSAIDAATSKNTAAVTVFAVDRAGNLIDDVTADVELSFSENVGQAEQAWFDITSTVNEVTFVADAYKYMTETGALKLNYTVDNASAPHGTISIAYSNSFSTPNTVNVASTPVVLDTTSATSPFVGGVTIEELLFGKIASAHLVVDTDSTINTSTAASIAVKKGYTGYSNTPVLSFLDKSGKAVVSGAGLYGFDTATVTAGNGFLVDTTGGYDTNATFLVEYSITNAKDLAQSNGGANDLGNTLTIASGNQASFTLVITKVTVANDPRVTDNGTPAAKNLLAAPKAVNVILK